MDNNKFIIYFVGGAMASSTIKPYALMEFVVPLERHIHLESHFAVNSSQLTYTVSAATTSTGGLFSSNGLSTSS